MAKGNRKSRQSRDEYVYSKYTHRPIAWYRGTGKLWKSEDQRVPLTEKETKFVQSMNRKIRKAWKARGEVTKAPTIGLKQARQYRATHSRAELREAVRKNLLGAKGMADPEFVDNMVDLWRNKVWKNPKKEIVDFTKIANVITRNRNNLSHSQMEKIKDKFYDWKNGNLTYEQLVENVDDIIYGVADESDKTARKNKQKRIERLLDIED